MNITKSLVVAALAAFATPVVTFAAVPSSITQNVPGTMNYQGYLADPSTGAAYTDGIYTLDIRLWNNAANKTTGCVWGGRYTVYVKGGYFNLMLGDPNATELTATDEPFKLKPTYANSDLWKALWGASDTDTVRYLGVTPHQKSNGSAVDSLVEIAPRQQLLASPYAYRAQQAQYAQQAQSNFSVPGNLTVTGTATFNGAITAKSGTQYFGPVKTTATTVNLGNGYTSATSANRTSLPSTVYDVGQYLYFYSYSNMYFQATAGNINFSVPSGYGMNVSGSGTFSSTAVNNTIGGTGATKITGSGASSINLNGTGTMNLSSSSSTVTLKGTSAYVTGSTGAATVSGKTSATIAATSGNVILKPQTSGGVYGQGKVSWASLNDTTDNGTVAPFTINRVTVTIPKGSVEAIAVINSYNTYYNYVVTGMSSGGYAPAPNSVFAYLDGSAWKVRVVLPAGADKSTQWTYVIHYMGVHKNFMTDYR